MTINKVYSSAAEAVKDVPDGASIMISGFGGPGGMAVQLITALRDQGAKDLTIISNTVGLGALAGKQFVDHSILVLNGQVKRAIASFPVSPSPSSPTAFERLYLEGKAELEMVPQGTLAERMRAGGAGLGGFFTRTGVGTLVEKGKEKRVIDGKEYIFEKPLRADFALIRALRADTYGNVVYRGTSRAFSPLMAMAAAITIVEVDEILERGGIDPEVIVTPGIFVQRIVKRVPEVEHES